MSTLKYDADGFCSDCLLSSAVKALILKSNNILSLLDCAESLKVNV
jgi:hypothetical protein